MTSGHVALMLRAHMGRQNAASDRSVFQIVPAGLTQTRSGDPLPQATVEQLHRVWKDRPRSGRLRPTSGQIGPNLGWVRPNMDCAGKRWLGVDQIGAAFGHLWAGVDQMRGRAQTSWDTSRLGRGCNGGACEAGQLWDAAIVAGQLHAFRK